MSQESRNEICAHIACVDNLSENKTRTLIEEASAVKSKWAVSTLKEWNTVVGDVSQLSVLFPDTVFALLYRDKELHVRIFIVFNGEATPSLPLEDDSIYLTERLNYIATLRDRSEDEISHLLQTWEPEHLDQMIRRKIVKMKMIDISAHFAKGLRISV